MEGLVSVGVVRFGLGDWEGLEISPKVGRLNSTGLFTMNFEASYVDCRGRDTLIHAHTCTSYLEDDNLHKLAMVYGADRSSCQSHMSTLPEREPSRCVVASLRRCLVASLRSLLKTSFATMTSSRASWGRLLRCDPWKPGDADTTKMQIQTYHTNIHTARGFEGILDLPYLAHPSLTVIRDV